VAGRGEQTRERILDVAERLYGGEGVANVSLRQIRIAAGQRNDAAVQYHFGDRDGIIRGLTDRHLPRIQEIARRVLDEAGARPSLRQLVDALVRPWAEYTTLGPSARAWIKIVAELGADPRLSFDTVREHTIPEMDEVGVALFDAVSTKLKPELAGERVWAISKFAIQNSADRARMVDASQGARPLLPDDAFVTNLVDMAYGALRAPSRT
jgi:AcrR family transcriptional regulator